MTRLPHPLRSAAIARPQHPAVRFDDGWWSYHQLCHRTAQSAGWLAAQGFGAGQRLGLLGPTDERWLAWFHAVGWLGATVAPLAEPADAQGLALDTILHTDTLPAPSCMPLPERFWPLDEPRLLLCTSGSTGPPSPVSLSTAQLLFSAMGSAIRLGHHPADHWLACLPMHHVGGVSIILRTAWYGTTLTLMPRFDALRVAAALDSGQITQVSLVPTMLTRVLDQRPVQPFPPQLRFVLLGGDSPSPELKQRCRDLGVPVAYTWGMTEAASQVATSFPGHEALLPLPFARVDCPEQALRVRGPLVAEEHLETQDHGDVDADGRVYIRGRLNNRIISGGEKVDPAHVERILLSHRGIKDAGVHGESDREWGQRVVATVVASATPADDADIQKWCAGRLRPHERPRKLYWCDALPRNAMGKLQRQLLGCDPCHKPLRTQPEPEKQ